MPNKKPARRSQAVAGESPPFQLSLLELAESSRVSELMAEEDFVLELTGLCKDPVEVTFTSNRTNLISVRSKESGVRHVRLQHAFRAADQGTMKALARFIHNPDKRCRKVIDGFIRDRQGLFESMSRACRRSVRLKSTGRFKNLRHLLKKICKEYNLVLRNVKITWGQGKQVSGNHSIKFGSYSHETGIITIHPALDSPDVPDYFIEYIIYHELLHAIFPPLQGSNGRRSVHSTEFKRYEKKFELYNEALQFERWFVKNRLS